ncbi:DMT family transporter [Bacillus cereus]|uniref:DMT family transporter n=1 Tax=Bacillus cereus TaxID=1396 RepID=UPI0018797D5C|nr:DMT family transporter [Bacillus cereus]MBE7106773.1 DMT family transporter [Bacillus cereus]MBE7121965.1 DMT family transporter [Bacillus cereus]
MWILFLIFAFLAGLALPIQFSINAQLRTVVGSPLVAATISFLVGAITLFTVSLFKVGFSFNKSIISAPWWVWTGGILGAFYVLATIILIPRIGAGTTVALVLAGQIVASVLIDHFGLINVPVHLLSLPRMLGAILVILGVVLIQKF